MPFLVKMLKQLAPRIGARVVLEPEWKIAAQIIFKNGTKRYFRYPSLGFNSIGASAVAKDKDYAHFFMKQIGYQVVPASKAFFRDTWAKVIGEPGRTAKAAYQYAQRIGFPVIVKPNSGTQGLGVALVRNKKEFDQAIQIIFKHDKIALVQRFVQGKNYRLVVLKNKVIWAYECLPLSIIGDGVSTILELLKNKQRLFTTHNRAVKFSSSDPRISHKLAQTKLALTSVLAKSERLFLLDNANLSAGGDSVDVTKQVHPDFKKLAVQLSKDMGLELSGIDIVVAGDIKNKPNKYWILEINYAPGLDFYPDTSSLDKRAVEQLYLEILRGMEKKG